MMHLWVRFRELWAGERSRGSCGLVNGQHYSTILLLLVIIMDGVIYGE